MVELRCAKITMYAAVAGLLCTPVGVWSVTSTTYLDEIHLLLISASEAEAAGICINPELPMFVSLGDR